MHLKVSSSVTDIQHQYILFLTIIFLNKDADNYANMNSNIMENICKIISALLYTVQQLIYLQNSKARSDINIFISSGRETLLLLGT